MHKSVLIRKLNFIVNTELITSNCREQKEAPRSLSPFFLFLFPGDAAYRQKQPVALPLFPPHFSFLFGLSKENRFGFALRLLRPYSLSLALSLSFSSFLITVKRTDAGEKPETRYGKTCLRKKEKHTVQNLISYGLRALDKKGRRVHGGWELKKGYIFAVAYPRLASRSPLFSY